MNFNVPPPAQGQPNPAFFGATAQQVDANSFNNPNRRPFSSFSGEGNASFSQGISNGMFSTDDLAMLGYDDGNDQGDPKRRRIARVCTFPFWIFF
jgi:hypothetical protein